MAALAVAAWAASLTAAVAASYPTASGPVVDEAKLLSDATRSALADQLAKDNQAPTAQLAVAIVGTTGGVSIEDYALGLFNTWGVGHRDDNDGALLVVAAEDRKLRIQTGRGLGDRLSDQRAKQIIDDHVVPRFKRDEYDAGVVAGVEAVRRQLGFGPGLTVPPEAKADDGNVVAGLLFVGALAAMTAGVVLFARRAARRNEERGGWYSTPTGGSDGSSSGGTGGFGGGTSGGGCASGGW
jgi:uncharacterized protein